MPIQAGTYAKQPERKEFAPIPEGVYQAEIANIEQITVKAYDNPDETEENFDFEFVILTDGPAKGRKLWKKVKPVIVAGKKPSFLYQIMKKAVQRPDLPEAEAVQIDVASLIGKQLFVIVNQKPGSNGKVYNNITDFSPVQAMLDPISKSEQPEERPRAGIDRVTTLKAMFALSRKLWPELADAEDPKEAFKQVLKRDLKADIISFSDATPEALNSVYLAMKNLESGRILNGGKVKSYKLGDYGQPNVPQPEEPTEEEINIEDIPF